MKLRLCVAQVLKRSIRQFNDRQIPGSIRVPYDDQIARIADWQRFQEHAVHGAENGRVRADAQRENQRDCGCVAGRPREHPNREPRVAKCIRHGAPCVMASRQSIGLCPSSSDNAESLAVDEPVRRESQSMTKETAFELAASSVRFGPGVTRDVGAELSDLGVRRVLLVTDPILRRLGPVETALDALVAEGLTVETYDAVRTEPSDASFKDAIAFAGQCTFDAIVSVGGGSTIDTAKAVNLYTTYPPGDFLDYVNAPIGKGQAVPGPLKPLIAIPTTAGTGSETTGVAILDITSLGAKTGISSPRLKPKLGLLDPDNTRTMPSRVAAFTGLDVLCHAIESYTALPYTDRPRVDRPSLRPTYQGANPVSDVWSLEALRLVSRFLVRAVQDPSDDEARGQMLLAASYAGLGFGNAGVHLPHAMSYPVAGRVKNYRPDGYITDHPLVPHGLSVILNAPAVFRFTAPANPVRHLEAAEALGSDTSRTAPADAGRILADRIAWFLNELQLPHGLRELGYSTSDIPALVEGTLLQRRLTTLSPRPAGADELSALFGEALTGW